MAGCSVPAPLRFWSILCRVLFFALTIAGLTGTLGDGAGKWRLLITAGNPVVGMSLLESASGHLTNISTAGVAGDGR